MKEGCNIKLGCENLVLESKDRIIAALKAVQPPFPSHIYNVTSV